METLSGIEYWEFLLLPIYLIVIYYFAFRIKSLNIKRGNSYYKYYVWGLSAKIVGSITFCLIYTLYYHGGDTTMYYDSTVPFVKLASTDFTSYIQVLFGDNTPETMSLFTSDTGVPYSYMYYDDKTCMVLRLSSFFLLGSFKSFLIASVLLGSASYIGLWKIFQLLIAYYPDLSNVLCYAVLFVPSITFWGSGILKDTYTMAATGLITYSFHDLLIKRRWRKISPWFLFLVSVWLLLAIKPYIFMAILPCLVIWSIFDRMEQTKNILIYGFATPVFLALLFGVMYIIFSSLGDVLAKFSLEQALHTAQIIQSDLQRSGQYGENFFNIGSFDGSLLSALQLSPAAIFAGLFRPHIFEARNIVMIVSGLENAVLLILSVLLLFKPGIKQVYLVIKNNSYVKFCLLFSFVLAFVIGLTTANFGALVRFKIPIFPFYLSALFIIYFYPKMAINQMKDK